MEHSAGDITELLVALRKGDRSAQSRLLEMVYSELHRIAVRYMRRERADHTLQATALIHEAYVKLVQQPEKQWQNRAHFYGVAAQVMRHVLVDYARAQRTAKRGGRQQKVSIDDVVLMAGEQSDELVALDEALSRLAEFDARQSRIVELRFFAGLNEEEIGEVLGIPSRTVRREFAIAKAWLYGELNKG